MFKIQLFSRGLPGMLPDGRRAGRAALAVLLLVCLSVAGAAPATAQGNPYAMIGEVSRVEYAMPFERMPRLANADTTSDTAAMLIDGYGQRYYGISHVPMWISVDPMADKYPGISPYAYCDWNPVKYVDPDGRKIKYHSMRDRIYVGAERLFNSEFRWRYNALKKSEETYVFRAFSELSGGGGELTTDGSKLYINYNTCSNDEQGTNVFVNLRHETEHAVQFEYGELGVDVNSSPIDTWSQSAINLDLMDEVKARDFGYESLNLSLKPNINVRNSWKGSDAAKMDFLSTQKSYSGLSHEVKNNENREIIKTDSQYMLPHRNREYL